MNLTDRILCMGQDCDHAALMQESSGKASRLVLYCIEARKAVYKLGSCPLDRWDDWDDVDEAEATT